MQSTSRTFAGHPGSVPVARRFVEQTVTDWGYDAAGWLVTQVVSELATNCSLHARTDFTIGLAVQDRCLRLEVSDGSPASPQPRRYSETATTGRGLRIVERLSAEWGVTTAPDGKTIWVLIPLDPPSADEDDDVDALLAAFDDGEVELLRPTGPADTQVRVAA